MPRDFSAERTGKRRKNSPQEAKRPPIDKKAVSRYNAQYTMHDVCWSCFRDECIIDLKNIKSEEIKMPDAQTQCRPMNRFVLRFSFLGLAERTASHTGRKYIYAFEGMVDQVLKAEGSRAALKVNAKDIVLCRILRKKGFEKGMDVSAFGFRKIST